MMRLQKYLKRNLVSIQLQRVGVDEKIALLRRCKDKQLPAPNAALQTIVKFALSTYLKFDYAAVF
jgi:hypothetical protein